MVLSLKLYESGEGSWGSFTNYNDKAILKIFCLCPYSLFMPNSSFAFSSSDHATFSKDFVVLLSLVNDAECHYEWTGVRVGVIFTLENLRAGENKKSEPQARRNRRLANQNVSHFLEAAGPCYQASVTAHFKNLSICYFLDAYM